MSVRDDAHAVTTAAIAEPATKVATTPRRARVGLAGRLLLVTVASVVLSVTVFYLTRVSAAHDNWLRERLTAAHTAAVVFDATGDAPLTADQTTKLLNVIGAKAMLIETPSRTIVLAQRLGAPPADLAYDLDASTTWGGISAVVATLRAPPHALLRVSGTASFEGERVELIIDEAPLVAYLWRVGTNFMTLSISLSIAVTLALWAALWQLVIRPVRRLTHNIVAFGEKPQDVTRIVAPSGRGDEIGRAERALATMQASLVHELGQRKRLAELGMAVARINHDLRNMLATAQLISDRLATIADPLAQRLAPQLVATLDRAIQFCQATLAYGSGRESPVSRRRFDLRKLVVQIVETAEATGSASVRFAVEIPPHFEVFADPDHMMRVLENLVRNASHALDARGAVGDRPRAIRFAAIRTTGGSALIEVSDTGPGFPPDHARKIFEPFTLSTSEGGAGLGLAIVSDLIARNGGTIALAQADRETYYCGARFLITLPTPNDGAAAASGG